MLKQFNTQSAKLFTHDDLDGIGSVVIAKSVFKKVDYELCNYDSENINEKVKKFFNSHEIYNYDKIFITDLSVNEEVAKIIESHQQKGISQIQLLDHHPTALWLNKYDWAKVVIEDYLSTIKDNQIHTVSGTYLLMNELKLQNKSIHEFVELVRQYDISEWVMNNNTKAKQLNDLLGILGVDKFLQEINILLKDNMKFTDTHKLLLELEQERIYNYIQKKNRTLIKRNLSVQNKHYYVGVTFAEQYHNELGNTLYELNPDVDFIIVVNMNKSVSYRGTRDDIDLGQVAKVFGGGGHPKASGNPISDNIRQLVIDNIFKERE